MIEQRPLGGTGLTVSALGFGAGAIGGAELDERDVGDLLAAAVEAGINLFDAARSYGIAEARLGKLLPRQRVVLSTKGGYGVDGEPDWTGRCIERGIDRALSELRTDWIDIFHLHSCPLEAGRRDDILDALRSARRAGKIRVAGYAGDNEALAWAVDSGEFGAVECSFNLVDQANRQTLLRAARGGVGVIAKRPLANGVWRLGARPQAADLDAYWTRWHELELRPSDGALALRFSAFAPGVSSAIVGCSRGDHLRENVDAIAKGGLAGDDARRLTIDRAWPAVT